MGYIYFYFYPNAIFKSNLGHIGCQFCTVKKLDNFSKERLSVVSINICQFINSLKISSTSGFIPFHIFKYDRRSCLKFCNVQYRYSQKQRKAFVFLMGLVVRQTSIHPNTLLSGLDHMLIFGTDKGPLQTILATD